jgi:hypothetical protein
VVAEFGEAGARDETDPPRPEDAERRLCHGYLCIGRRPLAISSIVSFESLSRSVFTTQ